MHMKKILEYFYNIHIDDMEKKIDKYMIRSGGNVYIFKVCVNARLLDDLQLYKNCFRFFKIILNKDSEKITVVDGLPYVLMDTSGVVDKTIVLVDLENRSCNSEFNGGSDCNNSWIELWETKVDFLELWLFENQKKCGNYLSIINYYVGFSENAIQYLKNTLEKNYQQKRINLYINTID